ncbi:MAG: response regulator transcription factor [Lachnospiraceae bacterium]|nr:response regulator transcription factor [Lachnospiraceae bacterium]
MKIMLAEDEKALSKAYTTILTHYGYEVMQVFNGEEAVKEASTGIYDCLILDIMMPVMDGVTALKNIRESGNVTPAIFLTAKAEIDDRVIGLDAGADDYIAKPVDMKELLARIRSLTRRATNYTPVKIQIGDVILNTEEQSIKRENSIRLAKKEAKLMELFMLNESKIITINEIINKVWHDEPETGYEVVVLYVSYLRDKLNAIDADIDITGNKEMGFVLNKIGY